MKRGFGSLIVYNCCCFSGYCHVGTKSNLRSNRLFFCSLTSFFRCWSHVSQVSLNCLSPTVTFCEISCVGLDWFSPFEMPEVWPEPWSWRTDCQTERSKKFVSPKVSCWIWFWQSPKQFGSLKLEIWMTCHSNVLHVSFKLCAIHCSTQHLYLACQGYDWPEADLSQHFVKV